MSDFKLQGLEDLDRKLKQLADPRKIKNIARKALRQGANVVRDAARQNAKALDDPESSERIWKNITVQAKRSKDNSQVKMTVGVRGGAKQYVSSKENVRKGLAGKTYKTLGDRSNPGGDTWYFRFIEFGTSRQPPTPFMRPALSKNIGAAENAFATRFNLELDKELQIK